MKKRILYFAFILALLAVMVTPAPALAADTGVTATLAPLSYTLTVPGTVSLGALTRGAEVSASVAPITATTDDGSKTTVTIAVKDGSVQGGKMKSGTDFLTNALQIAGGTLGKGALTNADQSLVVNATLSGGSYTLAPACAIYQTAVWADPAGAYSLTLTFTATFN